jgi:RND family efflux transporter MFP subunit
MNSLERQNTLTSPPLLAAEEETQSHPRLGRIAFVLLVLIVIAALAGFLPRWHKRSALGAETKELSVPTVSVTKPHPAKVTDPMLITAEVRPFLEAPIYARANGYLKKWYADIGSEVQAGQLLAEIDTPELNQELAQVRAQLLQAEAALDLAKTTAARWADLLKSASVSEQEEAEKRADLALKTATVEASRANVRRLEELQGFTRVLAPFAGTITARGTDVGQLITANSGKELFRLAQTKTLRVFVRVPQTAARAVTTGQLAEVLIPELPRQVFHAKVVRSSGAMNADSRTLLTELELDNSRNQILSGSFAQVRFPDLKAEAPLTVPGNAVIFRSEGTQVALVEKDSVQLKNVTLGRDFGPRVEVLSGLAPDDSVIVNPPDSLTSGMTVRVVANPEAESK